MVSMKYYIKKIDDIDPSEGDSLRRFLQGKESSITVYHRLEFSRIIFRTFEYPDYSLAVFRNDSVATGFVPQWRKGAWLESVPWRDKGGPVYDDQESLNALIKETRRIVDSQGLKGFVWKDAAIDSLAQKNCLVNVEIDLSQYTPENYWRKISNKVRGKIRKGVKKGLVFKEEEDNLRAVDSFYQMFLSLRRSFGVPVYPVRLFESYIKYYPEDAVKIFSAYHKHQVVGSMMLLMNKNRAVDAYSAWSPEGMRLHVSDFLIFHVIEYCLRNGINVFDFGADSPLQDSLIRYKEKWLGSKRNVVFSYGGDYSETDHNSMRYHFIREIIKRLPVSLYKLASRMVVR